MTDNIQKLKSLLETDVLVEVTENIKEIETSINTTKKKNELKELNAELDYMKQVKLYFDEVLIDIEKNILKEEDAIDILEGLEDMRADNQEV